VRDSFLIAWRGLFRGGALWMLAAAVAAVHFAVPGFVRSDGTAQGAFEMTVRLAGGISAAIIYVSVLVISCDAFAREREEGLLPLTLVRPVPAFSAAAGRWLAVLLLSACLLVLHTVLLNFASGATPPPPCRRIHRPDLPPAEVSAMKVMEAFMKSADTPDAVKKAPRAAILGLLTAKENERYEVIHPGETASWPFAPPSGGELSVRVRFSTMYNMQTALCGTFRLCGMEGTVSNSTQAVLEVPLSSGGEVRCGSAALEFSNTGKSDVMLRPRRDVELLSPGDSFAANSARAALEMLTFAGLLAAFGLFLSSALSRPVALFSAVVLLAAAMMAPDAVSQFPDEFHATAGERMGLAVSRTVSGCTSAFTEASPVSDLASGRAIPYGEVAGIAFFGTAPVVVLLLSAAALLLRRKTKQGW